MTAEGHRGLGPVARKGKKTFTGPARQKHPDRILHVHGPAPRFRYSLTASKSGFELRRLQRAPSRLDALAEQFAAACPRTQENTTDAVSRGSLLPPCDSRPHVPVARQSIHSGDRAHNFCSTLRLATTCQRTTITRAS